MRAQGNRARMHGDVGFEGTPLNNRAVRNAL